MNQTIYIALIPNVGFGSETHQVKRTLQLCNGSILDFLCSLGPPVTEQQYPYPSHVNPSGFVSIKLSSKSNYDQWREQMACLIESHGMQGFINGSFQNPGDANYEEWKRSDTLVKGWMFGSLSEDVMGTVVGLHSSMDVWKKLNTTYTTPPTAASTSGTNNVKDLAEYIPLYQAITAGDWETARKYYNNDNSALSAKLTSAGHRALHIAIANENMEFVKNLLKEINPNSLPSMVNNWGQNPLHYAAMIGNTAAAKMLVEQNPHLLFISDRKEYLPIHRAVSSPHKLTFLYLLKTCKQHIRLSQQDRYRSPFEGRNGAMLLTGVISQGILS